MGLTDLIEFVPQEAANPTVQDAFRVLLDRDIARYGREGYTGSWAEVSVFRVAPGRYTRAEAETMAEKALFGSGGDDESLTFTVSKFGCGVALEVCATDETVSVRTVTVTVPWDHKTDWYALRDEAIASLGLTSSECVVGATEVSRETGTVVTSVAYAPACECEPQYVLRSLSLFLRSCSLFGNLDKEVYATLDEARAALAAQLAKAAAFESPLEVTLEIRAQECGPLVTGTNKVHGGTITFEVQVATTTADLAGWLFYAVASS